MFPLFIILPYRGIDQLTQDGNDGQNGTDGEVDHEEIYPVCRGEQGEPGLDGDDGLIDPSGDIDNDGIINSEDNCIFDENPDQLDTDFDNFGNLCDVDDDNDGFADVDNCEPSDNTAYPGGIETHD